MLRELINNYIKFNIDDKNDVALLFSGGMDSLSILLSLLDCDIKPHLYSFMLDGIESSDIKKCREISDYYNLEYTEVVIPMSETKLIADVKYIIRTFGVQKKTAIQCIHPFIYMFEQISEKNVLTGLCADDLYGTSKKMAIMSKDKNAFNKRRIELLGDETSSGYKYIRNIALRNSKVLFAPYKDSKEITGYLLSLSYSEMNSPKQKNCMYEDYKDILEKNKWYRRNQNLQCSSKLREYHDTLLQTELNVNNNKVVSPIYKSIYKEYFEKKRDVPEAKEAMMRFKEEMLKELRQ